MAASAVPVTKALAFGDSITSGEETSGGQNTAYPRYLQTMYNNTITFVNVGVGGEHVKQGLQRIGSQLDYHRPNLLCLMEGIVDIVWKSSSFRYIEDHLTAMAQQALNRGIPVVIATLTPSVDATINRKIADFNANHIFKIGQALRIPVADTYSAIVSQPNWQTTLMNPAGDPGRVVIG